MKSKIKALFDEFEIEIGDEIDDDARDYIRRALSGDNPQSHSKFWPIWYAMTNDKSGSGLKKGEALVRTA